MDRFIIRVLVALLLLAAFSCQEQKETNKLMVILAHPDDESAVGQIMAKYAREQKKVYLIIAADGRYGVEDHAGIPPGDALVNIKKQESINACKILGIEPPIFLGAHDGFGVVSGLGEYFDQTNSLKAKIKDQIEKINPDAIITFGPDGDTGHLDHRGISDLTTELILREGWVDQYPLYYIAWPKEKVVNIPQGNMTSLNYVDKQYLTTKIEYTKGDREKLFKALKCYKSQFTEQEINDWIEAELKDTSLVFYLRRFAIDKERRIRI